MLGENTMLMSFGRCWRDLSLDRRAVLELEYFSRSIRWSSFSHFFAMFDTVWCTYMASKYRAIYWRGFFYTKWTWQTISSCISPHVIGKVYIYYAMEQGHSKICQIFVTNYHDKNRVIFVTTYIEISLRKSRITMLCDIVRYDTIFNTVLAFSRENRVWKKLPPGVSDMIYIAWSMTATVTLPCTLLNTIWWVPCYGHSELFLSAAGDFFLPPPYVLQVSRWI